MVLRAKGSELASRGMCRSKRTISHQLTRITLASLALLSVQACGRKASPVPSMAAKTPPPVPPANETAQIDSSGPPPRQIILTTAVEQDGSIALYPVMIWGDTGFISPDIDGDGEPSFDAFAKTYFRPGQRYALYSAGTMLGTAVVTNADAPGCSGIYASADGSFLAGRKPQEARLATNAPSGWSGSFPARSLTADELKQAYTTMAESLAARGVPTELRGAPDSLVGRAFVSAHGDTVVLVETMATMVGDSLGDHVISVFFIEESGGPSTRLVYSRIFDEHEANKASDGLADVMDFKHEGWPQVLIGSSYYESSDYTLLERRSGRWGVLYHGGGSGC